MEWWRICLGSFCGREGRLGKMRKVRNVNLEIGCIGFNGEDGL